METFSALLVICVGNSTVSGEFPTQRPVTRSFDIFFDLRLNKWLSKQPWGWWFKTLSCPLWFHCNETTINWSNDTWWHIFKFGYFIQKMMPYLEISRYWHEGSFYTGNQFLYCLKCVVKSHNFRNEPKIKIYNFSKTLDFTLTHWGRVTHICIGKLTIIGSDIGLSPERRRAIIWTNAGILLIGPFGTNFSEMLIGIQTFSLKKLHFKTLSDKWLPFCLGLNVLSK